MSDEEGLAQVREQLDAATKDLKKTQKQRDDALLEHSKLLALNVVEEAGFSASLADLFMAAKPDEDITAEAITSFAEANSIAPIEVTEDGKPVVETPAESKPGLDSMGRAGTRAGEGGQPSTEVKTLTTTEFVQLLKSDPAAAEVVRSQGRVKLSNENPYAPEHVDQTGDNPFDAFNKAALAKS